MFKDTYFIHKSTNHIVPTICINTIMVLKDNACKTSYLITWLLEYFRNNYHILKDVCIKCVCVCSINWGLLKDFGK